MADLIGLAKRLRDYYDSYTHPEVTSLSMELIRESADALERAHAELAAERGHRDNLEKRCVVECLLLRTRAEAAERRVEEAERVLRELFRAAESMRHGKYRDALVHCYDGWAYEARAFLATGKKEE